MTIRELAFAVPFLFAGWLLILIAVGFIPGASAASIILFPGDKFIENLPPSAAIVDGSKFSLTLSSEEDGFTLALYRSGAWIVLPAGLKGCSITVPKARGAVSTANIALGFTLKRGAGL